MVVEQNGFHHLKENQKAGPTPIEKAAYRKVEFCKMQKNAKTCVFEPKNTFFSKTKGRRGKRISPSDREYKSRSGNN